MSYKNLNIWALSMECVIEVHKMSFELPKFEFFETGAQIRRSSKSIKSNIVEGYGRRRYKKEYIRFLIFAQASNDETLDHLETLYLTGSLNNEDKYNALRMKLTELGKKLNNFIQSIEKSRNH